jgi:hypothetical protein
VTRLLVLVEGQSERAFVRDTLAPHLAGKGVYARPTIILTKPLLRGGGHRGGIANWATIRENLAALLGDTDAWVSTMLDIYGLPKDFPGKKDAAGADGGHAMADALEKQFAAAVGSPRFIPFLTLHEFEALVFASPKTVAEHFGLPRLGPALQSVVDDAGSPESINGGKNTHPKRRLERLLEGQKCSYEAPSDGPILLKKIGVPAIRTACGHFGAWVGLLESLGLGDGSGGRP